MCCVMVYAGGERGGEKWGECMSGKWWGRGGVCEVWFVFFPAVDCLRGLVRSRWLGDVYK